MAKHGWNMSGCPKTETGEWTGWYEWEDCGRLMWSKCQVDHAGWVHVLVAELGEQDRDANHIHVKYRSGEGKNKSEWVLAVVKIDEVRVINRGELLNKINALIGTKFTVEDARGERNAG